MENDIFSLQYLRIKDEIDSVYHQVMESGNYILGSEVKKFETAYASYCDVKTCIGVGNGLDAMHLVLNAWKKGRGDEVIVPSNTYIATWLAVSHIRQIYYNFI